MFIFAQLYLIEFVAKILKLWSYKIHWNGTWAVCEYSDCSTNWIKYVNNEILMLNHEPREEGFGLDGERSFFYHSLLLSVHYFIWAQFNNPTSIW